MFELVKADTNFGFIDNRLLFMGISALIIVASIAAAAIIGPTYGIDFRGGSDIILHFTGVVDSADVRQAADDAGLPDTQVQRYGSKSADESSFLVQTRAVSVMDKQKSQQVRQALDGLGTVKDWSWSLQQPNRAELTYATAVDSAKIRDAIQGVGLEHVEVNARGVEGIHRYTIAFEDLQKYVLESFTASFPDAFNPDSGLERMETVGARVGEQFRNSGIKSLLIALFFILVYVAVRFDIRYAPGAVAALIHDVIITVGFFTVFKIEVSLPTVAALLTIVGYSLNDTIVVFDRVRENLDASTGEPITSVVNRSINETLSRTIMTSLTTLLAVVAIAILGSGLIQDFAVALIVGIVVGTYSSVFVASPLMLRMDAFLESRREAKELAESQQTAEHTF